MRWATITWSFLLAICLASALATPASSVVINHENADIWQIPESAIVRAKETLHIAYGHTSHGSQLISGMGTSGGSQLDQFMTNNGATPDLYRWNSGGSNGALDLRDTPFTGASDLGNPDRYAWETATRNYLADHPETNVIIWSWCGQASTGIANIDIYLDLMEGLIDDYPEVFFVFMTGHLDGGGADGILNLANEHIRNHCIANDRILYDFADIESYDPDQLVNYMPLLCNDACAYDSDGNGSRDSNWALDWQSSHVEGVDWWASGAAHSQHLNGNLKGYAAWWLWATLAGWGQCIEAPSALSAVADPVAQEIELSWTDNSSDPNEDSFIIQRQVDGGAWDNEYATVASDETGYFDIGLAPGAYSYRVVAHLNDDGSGNPCNSSRSNIAAVDLVDPNLPLAPSDLVAVADWENGSVTLTWVDNSNNEEEFIIQRQVDSGPWNDSYDTVGADVETYLDDNHGTSLPNGTYTYRVVAANGSGVSDPSNEATAVISLASPNAPSNLTSELSGFDITLNWIDESDNEETFSLERALDGGGFEHLMTLPADTESYLDDNLAPLHTYHYRVRAHNSFGDSDYSNEASEYIAEETLQIVLKQSVDGYEGCRDAYLDAANPTYNYGGDLYNYVEDDPQCNLLISFDLPEEIEGKIIIEAKLSVYVWTIGGYQENQYLDLYRVTEPWTEGSADGSYQAGSASWDIRASDGEDDLAWENPGGSHAPEILDSSLIPNSDYYPEFDITALVEEWARGASENLGVLLKNESATSTGIKASEYSEYGRPYLTITYAPPNSAVYELGGTNLNCRLLPSYPNPCLSGTTLRFHLAEASDDLELSLFSIDGRCVTTLVRGSVGEGMHEVIWNGRDSKNSPLESGVYFVRLSSGANVQTKKIMIAR